MLLAIFINYTCLESVRTVDCFKRACHEEVHSHIFDRVQKHLKTHDITNIFFNFCHTLRAQFICKVSEEKEVECDEPVRFSRIGNKMIINNHKRPQFVTIGQY